MSREPVTAEQVAEAAAEWADAVRRNSGKRGQLQTRLYALSLRLHLQEIEERSAA